MSYEQFWNNLDRFKNENVKEYSYLLKSDCRSSTIFPVFKNKDTDTRLEFLSYWLKKHNNKVVICFTVRNLEGKKIKRFYKIIKEYKAITIPVSKYFDKSVDGFCGSIEAEIYSKQPPLFTYPALTLSIANSQSSSVIHSGTRIYNTNETISDYAIKYPQTGFDISFNSKNKNYICFFGGHIKNYNLKISLSEKAKLIEHIVSLKNNFYGQTHIILLEDIFSDYDLSVFKNPKCSIEHDFNDVFPRFYVGIITKNLAPTLTHTFYDTSFASINVRNLDKNKLRVSNKLPDLYFDCSFMIPFYSKKLFVTSLRSYAQNLDFEGKAIIKIYSSEGNELFSKYLSKQEINYLSNNSELKLNEIFINNKISFKNSCSVFFGFLDKNKPFPKRFKLGLNIKKNTSDYGTNICFSPVVMTPDILTKPLTRRWFPIGGIQNFIGSVHNTKFLINTEKIEKCKFSFEFINNTGQILERKSEIKQNGSLFLDVSNDLQLKDFFNNQIGWCMVSANTYFFDAYYISTEVEQIGGDHAF